MAITRVHFFSEALGMCQTCDVILPQRIDHEPDKKLPVLWLLHGMFGNHYDWIRRTSIERYAAPYGLAVVMPSGQNSFYSDMAYGGKYYTYISKELPQKMRGFFNFSDKREDNFIAGLSMGGVGSLEIGMANPENYAAIGCLSAGAGLLFREINAFPNLQYAILGDREPEGTYFDPFFSAKKAIEENKPLPRLYHTCGTVDPLLKYAHKTRDFFLSLPDNPFDYFYEENEGDHNWKYWDEHIQHFLKYLNLPETDQYC